MRTETRDRIDDKTLSSRVPLIPEKTHESWITPRLLTNTAEARVEKETNIEGLGFENTGMPAIMPAFTPSTARERHEERCLLACPWVGTGMCIQNILPSQALEDRRVSLGVLHGLKKSYHPHGLPPCIKGDSIDWSGF